MKQRYVSNSMLDTSPQKIPIKDSHESGCWEGEVKFHTIARFGPIRMRSSMGAPPVCSSGRSVSDVVD
jgi:hypothetical protein